jgi:hypothetical protein
LTQAGLPATFFRYNPQVQDLYLVGNWGQSTWDGLKLEVRRRSTKGVYLQANYTFSKGFTNVYSSDAQQFTAPYRDASNQQLDKGLSPLDATHVILMNGVWELPFGKGKAFLNSSNKVLNNIVGGWQLNGIYNYTTGRPLQLTTGRFYLNQNVASTPNFNGRFTNLNDVQKGPNQVTFISPAQAAAFSNPLPGSPGGTPLFQLHGPGFSNVDTSLFKSIHLDEIHEGVALQFRAEFFNVLNHTSFQVPSGTSSSLNINSATFGVITAAYPPRIGQLALKLNF